MAVIAPDGSMWTRSRCAMRRGTAAARRTHPMGPANPVNCAQAKAPTCSASGAQEKMELCKMATRGAVITLELPQIAAAQHTLAVAPAEDALGIDRNQARIGFGVGCEHRCN